MRMKSRVKFLKTTAIGGIFFLVPLVIVAVILAKAIGTMMLVVQPLADWIPIDSVGGVALANVIAVAVLLAICFLAGLASRLAVASNFVKRLESDIVSKIPGYAFLKGMTSSVNPDAMPDLTTVIVTLDDSAQIGMEIERLDDGRVVVYIPGSPNPWSGGLLIVSPERIVRLDLPMKSLVKHAQQIGRGTNELLRGQSAS